MLYNFGIIAYRCAIGVASLFNEKAALWVKGRKGIWKRMEAVDRGTSERSRGRSRVLSGDS